MNFRIERKKCLTLFMLPVLMVVAPACNQNDGGVPAQSNVNFAVTDAPIDDASVSGVFVTVADVQVGGKSIANFSGKQTINLEDYTDGSSKLLGSGEISEGDHSDITLVLDMDTDANGDAPGCYVLTNDQTKYSLASTTGLMKIALNHLVTIGASANNTVVFDFDLRKCVERNNDATVRYQFVDNTNLRDDIRLVVQNNTGTIQGSYKEDVNTNANKVIVYVYEAGKFNEETETQASNGQMFTHAVASAEVEPQLSGNEFTVAFLNDGQYELHFAGYTEQNGQAVFSGMLNSHTMVDGAEVSSLNVSAGMKLSVAATINGIL